MARKKKYRGQKALEFATGRTGEGARIAGKRTSKGTQKFKRDKMRWPEAPNQYGPLTIVEGTVPSTYRAPGTRSTSKAPVETKPRKQSAASKRAMEASKVRQHQRIVEIVGYAELED